LILCLFTYPAHADNFTVSLEVTDGAAKKTADTETDPPKAGGIVIRPIMEAKAGAQCTAKFKVVCTGNDTLKDVLIHFYVVKTDKAGQAPPALDPKDVVIETAQTMDFSDKTATSAELQFLPEKSGMYLIRVETQSPAEQKGREFYAAMDLAVK
jgi:hypothetical protein